MAKIYYDKDANLGLLDGKVIGILGYGSQGHAHAQNLRDSGGKVIVAEAEGTRGWKDAKNAGFKVMSAAEVSKEADIIVVLLPDNLHQTVYNESIKKNLVPGNMLMFAHGFNVHFQCVAPPAGVDVSMIAPKGPGHLVREEFVRGAGVPCLVAVYQDATGEALPTALAYGTALGGAQTSLIETTFKEETETDLFGEQTVLCGGSAALVKAGFEVLTEAGYQPEVAYFEVMHELKQIVDLYYRGGLKLMRDSVSDTAEYGGLTVGSKIITEDTKNAMRAALKRIQNGEFAQEWLGEYQSGGAHFQRLRKADAEHPIERAGAELRKMMPWIR